MRITSEDRSTVLEILLNDPDYPIDYSSCTFRVVVNDEVNPFSGQNDDVCFSAFDHFLKRLEEFTKTREGVAVLEMTEDCRLEFFRWNLKRDVGVRARITKFGTIGSARLGKTSLEVEFKVDGESVNQIHEDFAKWGYPRPKLKLK